MPPFGLETASICIWLRALFPSFFSYSSLRTLRTPWPCLALVLLGVLPFWYMSAAGVGGGRGLQCANQPGRPPSSFGGGSTRIGAHRPGVARGKRLSALLDLPVVAGGSTATGAGQGRQPAGEFHRATPYGVGGGVRGAHSSGPRLPGPSVAAGALWVS